MIKISLKLSFRSVYPSKMIIHLKLERVSLSIYIIFSVILKIKVNVRVESRWKDGCPE